jgi:hypothetical protein
MTRAIPFTEASLARAEQIAKDGLLPAVIDVTRNTAVAA